MLSSFAQDDRIFGIGERENKDAEWRSEGLPPNHGQLGDGWGAGALVFEEPALAFDAAAVAGEGAVGADDAMTGDDNSDGIGAVGEADCPDCGWAADSIGEFAVGDGGAERNLSQSLPYLTLEGRAIGFDWEGVDGGEVSCEVVADDAR